MSWPVWRYISHSAEIEKDVEEVAQPQVESRPITLASHSVTPPVQARMTHFDEKLGRLEEKYMARMETLARLLEAHNLQNQSIGDDMPKDLPQDVEVAWKAYLTTLSGLEKLKSEESNIEEDFIKMAHQGVSLKLIEI